MLFQRPGTGFKLRAGNIGASLPSMPAKRSGFQKGQDAEKFKFLPQDGADFKFKLRAGIFGDSVAVNAS